MSDARPSWSSLTIIRRRRSFKRARSKFSPVFRPFRRNRSPVSCWSSPDGCVPLPWLRLLPVSFVTNSLRLTQPCSVFSETHLYLADSSRPADFAPFAVATGRRGCREPGGSICLIGGGSAGLPGAGDSILGAVPPFNSSRKCKTANTPNAPMDNPRLKKMILLLIRFPKIAA